MAPFFVLSATYRRFLPAHLAPNEEDPAARFAPFLRDRDLGMFAGPADEFLGQVVGETLPIAQATSACRGEIVSTQALGDAEAGALRLSGWAWDTSRSSPPAWLLVANSRRIVVGVGAPVWRNVIPTGRGGDRAAKQWIAYSVSPTGDRVVEVWAVLSDQSLCRIGSSLRPVTADGSARRAGLAGSDFASAARQRSWDEPRFWPIGPDPSTRRPFSMRSGIASLASGV